jgi:hypothetical protein
MILIITLVFRFVVNWALVLGLIKGFEVGVLGTMERKFRLSFRHIPSKISAQVIPSRWQDRAEAAALLSSLPPA